MAAPLVEPYAGPALLTGRATAVFFHEVFGHRAEGFRQKDINEGQTFARKVGEPILPKFLSIYDDPTQRMLNKDILIGYYPFDDEGDALRARHAGGSRRAEKILKCRASLSPVSLFPTDTVSRQIGAQPVSRQGNLIVASFNLTVSNAELRKKLIEEIKRQGKTLRPAD